MLIIAFVCLISVSFAWFFTYKSGDIDDMDLETEAAPYVIISLDDEQYYQDVSYDDLSSLKMVPLSGLGYNKEGSVDLWKFEYDEDDNMDFSKKETPMVGTDYLTIDVFFKITNVTDIFLDNNSYIEPFDKTPKNGIYGEIAKDYIAGAVRASFSIVKENDGVETEELLLIWAPNKNYELTQTDGVYSITENGTPESSYNIFDGEQLTDVSDICKTELPQKLYSANGTEAEGTKLHFRIRIWIEGTDREAQAALSGGKFNVNISFSSIFNKE